MKHLVLISREERETDGQRILKLAEWMGVQTKTLTLVDQPTVERLDAELGTEACVVASLETLSFLHNLWPSGALLQFIEKQCAQLLVFSTGEPQSPADLLHSLSYGAVNGMDATAPPRAFRFPEGARNLSGPFSGQQFTLAMPKAVSSFRLGETGPMRNPLSAAAVGEPRPSGITQTLLADDRPIFLRLERAGSELFLLSMAQVPDISEILSPATSIEERYDAMLPLLIFLRHCFGDMCWHGIKRTGRLIIDDPLLQNTYGYLNFSTLRSSMRSAGYGTTVAFIPWNYWRTSKTRAISLFDGSPDLSVCLHGCDHTNKEFEDTDPGSLRWKTDTALQRMTHQEERTGVAFDSVMVFPQGRFTSPAISALRASGYLAAVNTTCFPLDAEARPLTIADFLRPAITKYDGFPIFPRRYPRRLIDFAFDAFVGRPLIIVQHHDDFRGGYGPLEDFITGLRGIAPDITWGSLADQLTECCLVRSLSERTLQVRFFTAHFRFRNPSPKQVDILFSREEPNASAISGVAIDGLSVPFSIKDGLLTFNHSAKVGQEIDVRIRDNENTKPDTVITKAPGKTHAASVAVRRALSEFRDNTLVKYPHLMAAAAKIATRLKVTGASGSRRGC